MSAEILEELRELHPDLASVIKCRLEAARTILSRYVSRLSPETRRELQDRENWAAGTFEERGNLCLVSQVADIEQIPNPMDQWVKGRFVYNPHAAAAFDFMARWEGLRGAVTFVKQCCGTLK